MSKYTNTKYRIMFLNTWQTFFIHSAILMWDCCINSICLYFNFSASQNAYNHCICGRIDICCKVQCAAFAEKRAMQMCLEQYKEKEIAFLNTQECKEQWKSATSDIERGPAAT